MLGLLIHATPDKRAVDKVAGAHLSLELRHPCTHVAQQQRPSTKPPTFPSFSFQLHAPEVSEMLVVFSRTTSHIVLSTLTILLSAIQPQRLIPCRLPNRNLSSEYCCEDAFTKLGIVQSTPAIALNSVEDGAAEENHKGDGAVNGRAVSLGKTLSRNTAVELICICRVPGISAVPHEDNLRYFDVSIHGPSQSPYEG